LIDADLVKEPARKDIKMYPIPANRIAKELGFGLSANMVFLGALQVITGIISESDLYFGIEQNVSPRVLQINTQAAKKGRDFIKSMERA
jgi:2-oxoglutarate ferredoxin oxidoreductase subunit gamma